MTYHFSAAEPEYEIFNQFVTGEIGKAVNLHIAMADESYTQAEPGSRNLALLSYFRAGMQINDAVRQFTRWHFASTEAPIRFLDFASAYGESTRFLAAEFSPDSCWAAGNDPAALQFQASEFKVRTELFIEKSTAFKPDRQWDCIFVKSFFNHLSEVEFTRWLWKLHSLLAPGGLLIFTACDPGSPVSLGFVHQSIIAVTGTLTHTWIPQGLCSTHDLLAIPKGPPQPQPLHFQYGPNGYVDRCRWTEPHQMKLTGWAFDRTPGESVARIEVYYNGRFCGSGIINHSRPDLAPAIDSGWDCTADLTGIDVRSIQDWVYIKAVSTSGHQSPLRLDHPSQIRGFESMPGWEFDESLGRSNAILPVKRFIDVPVNGHFTTADTTFSGWVASGDADSLEEISLLGTFGNVPYSIVQRPDVYAEFQLHSLGFEAVLPPEYLTTTDQKLRFVTRTGIILATFETVVDYIAGS